MDSRNIFVRAALFASVLAGVTFIFSWDMELSRAASIAWKGAGVGLLAVYAALRARDADGWLLAAIMAFGCAGDVLLEINFIAGAVAFLIGHMVSIAIYLRHRRKTLLRSQLALAVLLVPAVAFIAFMLPADRAQAPGVAFYSLGLATMAALSWTSRFPRFVVGIGALMFVVSDLLIFGRMGPLPDNFAVGLAVWGLYYFGEMLIAVGVADALAHWREEGAKDRVLGG